MKDQLSIIGCGWLGLALAKYLIAVGYTVKGSTTSKDKLKILRDASIEGFLIQLSEDKIIGNHTKFILGSETVIINVPPGLRKNPNKDHISEIKHFISAIEKQEVKNVLYISSTSVFKDKENFPTIEDYTKPNATSDNAKQLIAIEQMLQANPAFNTTILRFGGLFGQQRHPARYLSGKRNVSNPNAPINLIHKEDCITIIYAILKNNLWNNVFNAVYPKHPTKQSYYSSYCKQHNLELPEFNFEEKSKGKQIDSSKLVQLLNYSFKQAP